MYRRQALLALGSSVLAGCAGVSAPTTDETVASEVRSPTVTTEADDVPDGRNVDLGVETGRSFTETRPARIVVRFTNVSDSTERFRFGATPPFSEYVGRHVTDEAKLVAVPDDREDVFSADPTEATPDDETGTATRYRLVPTDPLDGCWYAGGVVGSVAVPQTVVLTPGETVTEAYTLLAHPLNERCLSPGEYRFEEESYFETGESWGFSVSLTR